MMFMPLARWLHYLDMWFLQYGGFTRAQLPFHERTWRLLWARGWGAQTMAAVIVEWLDAPVPVPCRYVVKCTYKKTPKAPIKRICTYKRS